ncbi:hypothetical protein DTO195F2_7664 [Paecilomyces variotii]|nr:hypothetical protein DTO195F2_7664 [Paecilomyces variotii]
MKLLLIPALDAMVMTMVVLPSLLAQVQADPNQRLLKRMESQPFPLSHKSLPIVPAFPGPEAQNLSSITSDHRHTIYSHNWAGVALLSSALPSTPILTSVAATITVPIPASSATNVQAASAWVGIDGFVNTAAILQTGIDIVAFQGEEARYKAWYEWYPDPAIHLDLAIAAGDVIVMAVYSTSELTGVTVIQNESTGQSTTVTVSAPHSTATLTGQSVEWIVEDYQSGGSRVSFLDFGTVNFTRAVARATGNQTFGAGGDGAVTVDMIMDNGSIVAEANIVGSSGVAVTHS